MRFINITIIDRFYQQWIHFHFKRHFWLFRRASWISADSLISRILLARWKYVKEFKDWFHVRVWSLRVRIVSVWKIWTRLAIYFGCFVWRRVQQWRRWLKLFYHILVFDFLLSKFLFTSIFDMFQILKFSMAIGSKCPILF